MDNPRPITYELERIENLSLPVSQQLLGNIKKAIDNYCPNLVKNGVIDSCSLELLPPEADP